MTLVGCVNPLLRAEQASEVCKEVCYRGILCHQSAVAFSAASDLASCRDYRIKCSLCTSS